MALDNARTPRRASGELITITGEEGIGIVNFIFFRYDGGDVGDDRTIHPCFCAFVFSVPDKTNLVDAKINFRDDFGAVLLLGVVEVAKHHIGHYCVLITVDKLLFGSSNNTVDVDGDDLPTLSDKVEGRDGRGGEGASEDCGGFHSEILSGLCSVWFPIIRYEVTNFARPRFRGFGILPFVDHNYFYLFVTSLSKLFRDFLGFETMRKFKCFV